MAYLAVPTRRGSLFQSDKSAHVLFQQKLAKKTKEYHNRHTRKSNYDDNDRVVLNVGGTLFKTRKSTLRNVPSTKLGRLSENNDQYDHENDEYFFDRNPFLFSYILDFYRTGNMHIPRDICSTAIQDELKFWELGDGCISECCRKFYFDELDQYTTYDLIKAEFYNLPTYTAETPSRYQVSIESRFAEFKRKAWVFIDNHESSLAAKIFAVIYYGLVVISILSLFISTIPEVRVPLRKHVLIRSAGDIDETPDVPANVTGTLEMLLVTDPPDILVIIDMICMFFFTVEFMFRLVVCPSLKERFRSWYTLLDILYLAPAWTRFLIDVSMPFFWQHGINNVTVLVLLDAMMVLRVLRIFRLSRHYRGLRVLLLAIKASVSELMLLVVFVMFALTIYASFLYCAEHYSGKDKFRSIFIGLWWSLITLTTVGYGDYFPETTVGYLIASCCAITGLLIIGMVVPIIAGNFHLYYGFRHAGCEDIVLEKPEFIPPEDENPAPNTDFEGYTRKLAKPSSRGHEHSLSTTSTVHESQENFHCYSTSNSTVSANGTYDQDDHNVHKRAGLLMLSSIRRGNSTSPTDMAERDYDAARA